MIIKNLNSLFNFGIFIFFSYFSYSCRRCCKCCQRDYVRPFIAKIIGIKVEKNEKTYEIIKDNYDKVLNLIKNLGERRWRMLIDANRWDKKKGKYVFDVDGKSKGEPGYIDAMLNAWDYMISTLDQKIEIPTNNSLDLCFELHKRAVNNVKNMLDNNPDYRNNEGNYYFNFASYIAVKKDHKELIEEEDYLHNNGFECEKKANYHITEETVNCCDFKSLEKDDNYKKSRYDCASKWFASLIFKDYYEKLDELKKNDYISCSLLPRNSSYEDKILEIFVRIVKVIVYTHLFCDGNTRYGIFLILNKFLIENKMLPVIFDHPDSILEFKVEKAIELVKEGQNNFCRMVLKDKN